LLPAGLRIATVAREFQAAERLKDAALVIADHPIALQLRYLQTLLEFRDVLPRLCLHDHGPWPAVFTF
jgi:hypothetical protein